MSIKFVETKELNLPEDFNERFETFKSVASVTSVRADELDILDETIASYPNDIASYLNSKKAILENQLDSQLSSEQPKNEDKEKNTNDEKPKGIVFNLGKLLTGDKEESEKLEKFFAQQTGHTIDELKDSKDKEDTEDQSVVDVLAGQYIIPLPGLAYTTKKGNAYDYVLLSTGANNKTGVEAFDIKKPINEDVLFDKDTLRTVPKKYRKYAMSASQFIENQEAKLNKLFEKKEQQKHQEHKSDDEFDFLTNVLGLDKQPEQEKQEKPLSREDKLDAVKTNLSQFVNDGASKAKEFGDNTVKPTLSSIMKNTANKYEQVKKVYELQKAIRETEKKNKK